MKVEIDIHRGDDNGERIVRAAPRGIGLDVCNGCFVDGYRDDFDERCKTPSDKMVNNVSFFVNSRESGEVLVALFEVGARLDYRHFEPKWIQVKVGACDRHKPHLEKLVEMVDGTRERKDGPGVSKAMILRAYKRPA